MSYIFDTVMNILNSRYITLKLQLRFWFYLGEITGSSIGGGLCNNSTSLPSKCAINGLSNMPVVEMYSGKVLAMRCKNSVMYVMMYVML